MKKSILLILIFNFTFAYSQDVSTKNFWGTVPKYSEILDFNGKPIPIGGDGNIIGSPLIQEKWSLGLITLANGVKFSDSSLNYSLYDDKLFFKRNDNTYPINLPVKEFLLLNQKDTAKTYLFQTGYPAINNKNSFTFYEVLFAGKFLKLLKWQHKKIVDINSYGGADQKEYFFINDYYVFMPKLNKIISLGMKLNLNELKKNISEYEIDISNYNSSHKLNTKKDEDVIQLFYYLDSLKK
jgi:hypothetical protein